MLKSTEISIFFSLIDQETPKITPQAGFGWESYHTFEEIYDWLDELLAEYPNILTPHLVGYSYEGREIRAVKLSHRPVTSCIILIDCCTNYGIH